MDRSVRRWFAPVACVLSFGWLGYEVLQWIVPPQRFDERGRIAELYQRDPKVGAAFPVAVPASSGRTAFVWMGDCDRCTARALPIEKLKEACPEDTRLVLLAPATSRGFYANSGLRMVALSNAEKDRIHAFFAPRVYIVSSGRLERLQSQTADPLEEIRG